MQENEQKVEYKINFGYGINGVVFNLYRENKPIVESPKNGCLFFIAIFFVVLAYKLITVLVQSINL